MRGKVGGLSPPYFKSRGAIAPLAPLLPPPLSSTRTRPEPEDLQPEPDPNPKCI